MDVQKKQTVTRSSAKAEYRSIAAAVAEVIWIVGLLKDLCVKVSTHVHLYCDSKTAMQIVANLIFHERTKHIEIDCHFVREKVKEGLIHPVHVSTKF